MRPVSTYTGDTVVMVSSRVHLQLEMRDIRSRKEECHSQWGSADLTKHLDIGINTGT